MPFINDDFLLESKTARHLYHKYAAPQPILDFHSHLSPEDIAENRRFANLHEIWLEGDHYKWRAMRANGVAERFCTGDASPEQKFQAWASTVPRCLRNPLYHWTHLELKRYFGIGELLNEKTGPAIWKRAGDLLAHEDLSVHGILAKFQVRALCTTDDPAKDLSAHAKIAASGLATRVHPTFRPDRALDVNSPSVFNSWVERLAAASDTHISRFSDFLDALRKRHSDFHEAGCRLSDHGLAHCYEQSCKQVSAAAAFDKARSGHAATSEEHANYGSFLMDFFGRLDAEKGWTKQLHLGANRNVNTRAFDSIGPDAGFDSIGDWPQARFLGAYMDRLERQHALPRMILYNVNPTENYAIATMAGNFQSGSVAGKIQFGSAWWFLDQKDGMEEQLNVLSNVGLLSRFVGMLTDSRSFMSFPRHEYFRRILCNLLGREIESGELPDSEELVGPMIEDICFRNANRHLGLREIES
jgi:glucuronate isomerase